MGGLKKYYFGKVKASANFFWGNSASLITSESALATKLGISVSRIKKFQIINNNVQCFISGSYSSGLPNLFNTPVVATYLIDTTGFINTLTNIQMFAGGSLGLINIELPGLTYIKGAIFYSNPNVRIFYVPMCTNLGEYDSSNIFVGIGGNTRSFTSIQPGFILYCHPSLATANAGGPIADINTILSRGGIVRYVTDFTKPSNITDLSAGTIYNDRIQLTFTTPSSTNTIDYYNVYVNGVLYTTTTTSSFYVASLTPSTTYTFVIVPVDIYYNKSTSNTLIASTNTTLIPPFFDLVSYYKLDSSSVDSKGSANGSDTSISYVSGKISNCASFNGTTSKIRFNSSIYDKYGTASFSFAFWINVTSFPASGKQARFVMIEENSSAGIRDKGVTLNNNGSIGFYGYDGSSKEATSPSGAISLATWYFITATYNGNTLKLYINSTLVASIACSSTYNFTTPVLVLSQFSSSGTDAFYNGLIDEFSFHNVSLSQTTIDSLYNGGSGLTY